MSAPLDTTYQPDPAHGSHEFPREHEHLGLLAAIIQSAQEIIIAKTVEGTITVWNPTAERVYGYSAEEAVGKSVSLIVPPEKMQEWEDVMGRLQRGETIKPFETTRTNKAGESLKILLSVSPILDEAGEVIGASAFGTNVTQARHLEASRDDFERRLKIAIETARIGVWEWCLTTNRVIFSSNLETIHQLERGTFGGTFESVIQGVLPEDRAAMKTAIEDALRARSDFRFEYRLAHRPDIWVEARGRFVAGPANEPEKAIGICMDITDRKRSEAFLREEATLRESEKQFRELVEALPHMVWISTPEGTSTYANRQLSEYTGVDSESLLRGWDRVVHPEDLGNALRLFRDALETQLQHECEVRIRNRNGEYRWNVIRLVPIRNARGELIRWVGSGTDIDLEKRTSDGLKLATQNLEYAVSERTRELNESISSLDTVLYNIGHHLRAPLRAMNGFARILMEDSGGASGEAAQDAANRIVGASSRMDLLLRDLLAYGRISHEVLSLERTDVERCLSRALAQMAVKIREVQGRVEVHRPIPPIIADQNAVTVVLEQLIENALKFVRVGQSPLIEVSAESKGPLVRIYVKDNGIGVAAEYHARIFHPFETLHGYNSYPGTGIGLAIVSKAIQRMRGAVGVESTPGHGSAFWFELTADRQRQSELEESDFSFLRVEDPLIITGLDGRIRWVNQAFERMCGYKLDEVRGRKPGDFLQGPKTDPVEIHKLRNAIYERKRCSVTLVNYRRNGETYWIHLCLGPVRVRGRVVGFVSAGREVTLPVSTAVRLQLARELGKAQLFLRRTNKAI